MVDDSKLKPIILQKTLDYAREATDADIWFHDLDPYVKVHLFHKYKGKETEVAKEEFDKLKKALEEALESGFVKKVD